VSEQQSVVTMHVSASTEHMSVQIEEMSARARGLASTAEHLKELVARLNLDDHAAPAASGVRKPAAKTVTPLRRVA
jgi:hypothetical protein